MGVLRVERHASIMKSQTVEDVMNAIADSKSLDMFCSNAKESIESEVLKETKGLTKKQYYTRISQLLKVGLIKRKNGRFSLTAFGAVIYHAQLVIESGIKNFLKLKAVDSIKSSTDIREHKRVKLIKSILGDIEIERILTE
jgi:hypothetical protein